MAEQDCTCGGGPFHGPGCPEGFFTPSPVRASTQEALVDARGHLAVAVGLYRLAVERGESTRYSELAQQIDKCVDAVATAAEARGRQQAEQIAAREIERVNQMAQKAQTERNELRERVQQAEHRFAWGMNTDDHASTCAIRSTRDGWDADCTCGMLIREAERRVRQAEQARDEAIADGDESATFLSAVNDDLCAAQAQVVALTQALKDAEQERDFNLHQIEVANSTDVGQLLQEYQRDLADAVNRRDDAIQALKDYGQHKIGCPVEAWNRRIVPADRPSCTCGLDAALTGAQAPEVIAHPVGRKKGIMR